MKTYYAIDLSEEDGPMRAPVHKTGEVAIRIDALERALKSCAAVIKAEVKERRKFEQAADDALLEADKALA